MVFKPTSDRRDLAAEFKSKPYGHHSPELEAALDQLRLVNPEGKIILVCTRPGREWTVAHLAGDPPTALLHTDLVFESLEQAEWVVFKIRWEHLTGNKLEAEAPA